MVKAILIIVFAVCCVVSALGGFVIYRMGLRDGIRLSEGKELKPIRVKTPSKSGGGNEHSDRVSKGLNNILNYQNRRSKS